MADDIVNLLRSAVLHEALPDGPITDLVVEAADEIVRLRADLEEERQRRRDDLIGQQYRDEELDRLRQEADRGS